MTVRFENKITAGNLYSIGVMVFAAGVAWATTQADIRALDDRQRADMAAVHQREADMQRQMDEAMIETRRVRPEVETRLRQLEVSTAQVTQRLSNIETGIAEIKALLKEAKP